MKKYLTLIIFHLSLITFCDAQNPLVKQWDKRFGGASNDRLFSFQQTTDGGYILGGYSSSGINGNKTQNTWGGTDYWIVKIDSLGNKQWDKVFGGTSLDDLESLQQTTDGGYILGGVSYSHISGDKTQNTHGDCDYWIIKVDSLGNKQWDKDFGGLSEDRCHSLHQTTDGGYILGGSSRSPISGDKTQNTWGLADYWIVKIDSLGIKQWDKNFGGNGGDILTSIQQTADGGYILGGYSYSDSIGDKTQNTYGGGSDYWIVKIDSLGDKQWDKDFGGQGAEMFYSIQQTTDRGYILGGWSSSNISGNKTQNTHGGSDNWILKIDSLGTKQWDKDFGGTDIEGMLGNVTQTSDGGYLIASGSSSPISGDKTEANLGQEQTWIVKTDSMGNLQWDKTLLTTGYNDEAGWAIQTKDGCFAMANYTYGGIGGDKTQPSWGYKDYWIIKFCDTTGLGSAPIINLSCTDTIFCEKQCINFLDLSQNAPTSWQWYFPGASPDTSTLQNPTNICYNSPGFYPVTLVASNLSGSDSLTFTNFISVNSLPVVSLGNDTVICIGDTLLLNAGSGFAGYLWQDGSSDSTFVITAGSTYWLQVSNGMCTSIDTILISTITCAQQPVAMLMSSDSIFCEKQCINFFDLSQNAPTSWQWYFPGASPDTSTQQNPTNICYNLYGNYNVTLVACNAAGCDSVSFPGFINVLPTPPSPVITVSNDTLFASGPYSFAWYEVSNPAVVLGTDSFFVFTPPGSYYVIATDSNGCAVVSNVVNTGVQSPGSQPFTTTPNPASNELTITYPHHDKATIHIMNTLGETLLVSEIKTQTTKLNISSLSNGIYFLQFNTGGRYWNTKFVVER